MSVLSENSVAEWKKELTVMSENASPYICRVYGYASERKVLTIVMEYMQKGDLFNLLEDEATNPMTTLQKLRMARHIALGIHQLHSNGIIHRDIKSMNVLVTDDFSCKLADFGTAKLNESSTANLMNTANAGTPLWMAPEVKFGQYGFPADIYSLGLVLFEMFQGPLITYWNPQNQTLRLPVIFKASSLVLPCVNVIPTSRPTAMQVSQQLDWLTNKICVAARSKMGTVEKSQLRQAAIATGVISDQDLDRAEIGILYRHLLKLPNIDEIVPDVFAK